MDLETAQQLKAILKSATMTRMYRRSNVYLILVEYHNRLGSSSSQKNRKEGLQGSYEWSDLWSAVELERTNNNANGFSFPEYQLATQILGICVGQCWPPSDYVATSKGPLVHE